MILICYGTRPEYIKVKPLIEKMTGVIPFEILYVGQHIDLIDGVDGFSQDEIVLSFPLTNHSNSK